MLNKETQSTKSTEPTILTIVGITGNLSRKKLLPAIERLAAAGELPDQFKLVGTSRRAISVSDLLADLPGKPSDYTFILERLEMVQLDPKEPAAYEELKEKLSSIEASFGGAAQRLFHLSVPPQFSQTIIEQLGKAGLAKLPTTKLLLEKPFGSNVSSARELAEHIRTYFKEEQVYRIDHYLAKEMAQNLLTFRRENSLFRRTWHKEFIERIEIVAAEEIGIEGRIAFYEQAGALGDFVQSHLLQLAAITLMDLPLSARWKDIPSLRLDALKLLHTVSGSIKRAQYKGYADEVGKPDTKTETFVSLTLQSDDPVWKDVPIILTTGKALDRRNSEIRLHYRKDGDREANELVLQIQPQEGIGMILWSKRPGFDRQLERVQPAFHYREQADTPQPYEQVFLSAIQGDHTLFTSHEEVLASWKILEPVQRLWSKSSDDLVIYEPGQWPQF